MISLAKQYWVWDRCVHVCRDDRDCSSNNKTYNEIEIIYNHTGEGQDVCDYVNYNPTITWRNIVRSNLDWC
jgi:hypothetical protein